MRNWLLWEGGLQEVNRGEEVMKVFKKGEKALVWIVIIYSQCF